MFVFWKLVKCVLKLVMWMLGGFTV